jgi:thiamine biosynthesis protein ThiS
LRININGEPREVKDNLILPELISSLNLRPEQIAIELNQTVIRRAQWQATTLQENDKVEIVHFVGGGVACNANC